MQNLLNRLFRNPTPAQPTLLSPAQQEMNTLLETAAAALEHGFPATALDTYQRGLTLARTLGDAVNIEHFLSGIGAVYISQSNFESARSMFDEALEIARKIGDPRALARCLNNVGSFYSKQKNWNTAQTFHQQALDSARQSGQADVIALTLENLAQDYLHQENPSYAQHLLKEAVVITQAGGQFQLASRVIGTLAETTLAMGDRTAAQKLWEQAIYLAQRASQTELQLRWLQKLAELEMDGGEYTKAIQHLQEGENLALRLGNQPSEFFMNSALALATAYRRVGNSAQAEEYATRALAQARSMGSASQEMMALTRLGMAAYGMGDLPRAHSFLAEALAADQTETASDRDERIQIMLTLGKIAMRQDRLDEASQTVARALELARAEQQPARQAEVLHLLGSLVAKQGHREAALGHWQAALQLLSNGGTPDYAAQARLRCDMAQARRDLGDFKAALDEFEKALVLLNHVNHAPTRGMVLSNAATLYTETGDIDTAQAFYDESIEIAHTTGDQFAESLRLGNLGWFYSLTGRPQMAIDRLERAIKISRDLDDTLMIAVQSNNLAGAYTQTRDFDAARGLHKQAVAAATALGSDRWLAVFLSDMAATLVEADRLDEAESLYRSALERTAPTGDLETLVRTQSRLAMLYARFGRFVEALPLASQAEARARKMFYQRGWADANAALGDIARGQGDQQAAQKYYVEAHRLYTILHDPTAQRIAPFLPTSA